MRRHILIEDGDADRAYVVSEDGHTLFVVAYADQEAEDRHATWMLMIAPEMWERLGAIDRALQSSTPDIVTARKLARDLLARMGE